MVNVIGLGYIGLPTALILAAHGTDVVGTDLKESLISKLNAGETTFKEPGLDPLFHQAIAKSIRFTTEYQKTDTYIISVPTPYDAFSKKVDVCYVLKAFEAVLRVCEEDTIIVIESTISPGTIDKALRPRIAGCGKNIHLVHAPERIIPGNMLYELVHNNRVIGADDPETGEQIRSLYATFCKGEIVVTSIKAAEMSKVVENTFRAVNIAFANELTQICRHDNMDVREIIRICNLHPRVNILSPGPGVGGHCISVDPWFLVGDYPSLTKVIGAAMEVNSHMPEFVMERIRTVMEQRNITDPSRVGLYGITYKEDVDDVRESPTLQLLNFQKAHLAQPLKVFDPLVPQDLVPSQYHDLDDFLRDVDMVVIMVGHKQFLEQAEKFRSKVILDTRNIYPFPGAYTL